MFKVSIYQKFKNKAHEEEITVTVGTTEYVKIDTQTNSSYNSSLLQFTESNQTTSISNLESIMTESTHPINTLDSIN